MCEDSVIDLTRGRVLALHRLYGVVIILNVWVWDVRSVHPSGRVGWAVGAGGEDGGTPVYLYPERGGVYFNIPRASRQRALIINKLGTRHGVPQGDQPEQSQNRETDRERTGCVKETERGRREGEEKTERSRQERFGNDIEEQVGEESR